MPGIKGNMRHLTSFDRFSRQQTHRPMIRAGVQATAIKCAVCSPLNALRRCSCTLSCNTRSNPPSRYRLRAFQTVAELTSSASVIVAQRPSIGGLHQDARSCEWASIGLPSVQQLFQLQAVSLTQGQELRMSHGFLILSQYTCKPNPTQH